MEKTFDTEPQASDLVGTTDPNDDPELYKPGGKKSKWKSMGHFIHSMNKHLKDMMDRKDKRAATRKARRITRKTRKGQH